MPKVAPVVLRRREELEILAFRHPRAGLQLVKGTWEEGESAENASLRELAEESGIQNATVVKPLGQLPFRSIRQHWHFYLCQVPGKLPIAGPSIRRTAAVTFSTSSGTN